VSAIERRARACIRIGGQKCSVMKDFRIFAMAIV
jgi:hypothetical protein